MLVIFSHTPELRDGNTNREILTNIFGSISFGGVAVDAFFFISGYLISASWEKTKSPLIFMKKRVSRIYPGFIVASLFCTFIVAPLGGGSLDFSIEGIFRTVGKLLLLRSPDSPTAFLGTFYPSLNGAMWTIPYEFRCYILVLLLGVTGAINKKAIILPMTLILLILSFIYPSVPQPFTPEYINPNLSYWDHATSTLIGDKIDIINFTALYMCGVTYRLFVGKIIFSSAKIAAAIIFLCLGLFELRLANVAVGIFGGYLILASAYFSNRSLIGRINKKNDISYGVYLYAWPIEKLIYWNFPSITIMQAGFLTCAIAIFMGTISWHIIEKPIMELNRRKIKESQVPAAT
jgi:peptidoglycan/LPS O-acetylase OafA/YrhL